MSEVHVAVVDGAFRCYRTTTGLDREYFGPRFGGPHLAGQYADLSAGRPISPLRRRAESPSPDLARLGTESRDEVAALGEPPDLSPQVAGTHPQSVRASG